MTTKEQLEAAEYLGIPVEDAAHLPDGVVAAVTAAELGMVPRAWLDQGFDALTDNDREQVLRFARFLEAARGQGVTTNEQIAFAANVARQAERILRLSPAQQGRFFDVLYDAHERSDGALDTMMLAVLCAYETWRQQEQPARQAALEGAGDES